MISVNQAHLFVAARSHPGMSGKTNEDRYSVVAYRLPRRRSVASVLAIVTDGIGGHRAGEIAAEIAIDTIQKSISKSNAAHPVEVLREAAVLANQTIIQTAEGSPQLEGMGTTCACGWVIGDRLYTVSVGDSRIYLVRGNTIRQISVDHTWVQEAVDNGILSPEEARSHPNSHVIRRFLGSRNPVVPDMRLRLHSGETDAQSEANQGLRLFPGDQVFLCSDGLTDLISEEEILATLKNHRQELALDQLITLTNQRGGHDNITAIALEVPRSTPTVGREAHLWGKYIWSGLAAAVVLITGLAALLAGYWYVNRPQPTPTSIPVLSSVAASVNSVLVSPTATQTVVLEPASLNWTSLAPTAIVIKTIQPPPTLSPWPTNTRPP